jgi:hypothetical protein
MNFQTGVGGNLPKGDPFLKIILVKFPKMLITNLCIPTLVIPLYNFNTTSRRRRF